MSELSAAEQDKLIDRQGKIIDIEGARLEMNQELDKVNALSKAYASDPDLWKLDDLISKATDNLYQRSGSDLELRAIFTASVEGMVRELSEASDTPLIRLYARAVAVCWFRWQLAQGGYPGIHHELDPRLYKTVDFWDRHLAIVQGQYLKALDAFARAKRSPLPVVVLNYADKQQINMGIVTKAPKGKAT